MLLGAPGLFRPLTTYKIYFDNAAGIKLGAPVLLAGRKIGQVAKLYSPVSKEESQRAVDVAKSLRAAEANATPAPEKAPRYEVRIDVQVDRGAQLYRDSKARMITLGLLGEVAIDFTEGTESSGRAKSGEVFAGERVPDFGEAIARMLDIIAPVATEATATFKQLELTAQNLSHITDETSELNLALTQFKNLGEHLNQLTGPESALSISLYELESNYQRSDQERQHRGNFAEPSRFFGKVEVNSDFARTFSSRKRRERERRHGDVEIATMASGLAEHKEVSGKSPTSNCGWTKC